MRRKSSLKTLLICNLFLSIYQGYVLTYGNFGEKAILAGLEDGETLRIPPEIFWNYIHQHLVAVLTTYFAYFLMVFIIQCIPIAIFNEFKSSKGKVIASLCLWAAPAIIGLPTIIFTALYLFSPVYAIGSIPAFTINFYDVSFGKEEFVEGLTFSLTTVGWFNIFWLLVMVKYLISGFTKQ